jgi:hypothetical protein
MLAHPSMYSSSPRGRHTLQCIGSIEAHSINDCQPPVLAEALHLEHPAVVLSVLRSRQMV